MELLVDVFPGLSSFLSGWELVCCASAGFQRAAFSESVPIRPAWFGDGLAHCRELAVSVPWRDLCGLVQNGLQVIWSPDRHMAGSARGGLGAVGWRLGSELERDGLVVGPSDISH